MRKREDFTGALKGIEVFQLTEDDKCNACHVYMEAQIFTPDSKRFVLHRSATAHSGKKDDPEHRYLLCGIENGCSLMPITDETGATGPVISPDGRDILRSTAVLTVDLVHPSPAGMEEMALNLSGIIRRRNIK